MLLSPDLNTAFPPEARVTSVGHVTIKAGALVASLFILMNCSFLPISVFEELYRNGLDTPGLALLLVLLPIICLFVSLACLAYGIYKDKSRIFHVMRFAGYALALLYLFCAGVQAYKLDNRVYTTVLFMIPVTVYSAHICSRYARLLDIQANQDAIKTIPVVQLEAIHASV